MRDGSAHATGSVPDIRPVPRDGHLPLSCSQERLWFLLQLHPGIRAYQFQAVLTLAGTLNTRALAAALTEVVRRHEVYRTTFAHGPDGPRQVVHPPYEVSVPVVDLRDSPDPEAAVRRAVGDAVDEELPVDRLPLVHWRLLRTADDRHVLLHLEHHLIHDGWAFNVFIDELCALYEAFAEGRPSPLPEPGLQFADFAAWQHAWLDSPAAERQLAYWRDRLADVPPFLELATDRPRTAARRFAGDAPRFAVPAHLTDRVRSLARHERVSLFAVMLAAFQVLLHGWSEQDRFSVASGLAGRGRSETDRMLGMVVNTVALDADLRGDPTFRELLGRVRATVFGALEHQDLPFDRVIAALRPPRVPGRQALCEVLFAFHDAPMRAVRMPGLDVEVTPGISNGSAKFDLNVIAIPVAEQAVGQRGRDVPGGVEFIWEYDRDLFDATTVARAAADYERLLAAVVADPQVRVSELVGAGEDLR
ncbi:condensation domain-containing protein [Streptomyces sp. NPDC048338]|uniref:condensation domain-containing protein n=1 Tax=Streptomyces sp. NPDC048338 TaxID=3365536 RepID=UPI003714B25F